MNQIELETLIKRYQKSYYDGHEEVSDAEFDKLWDELTNRFPDSQVLKGVGEDSISGAKIKHLMVVGSQDKFNTVEAFHKWLKNEKIKFPLIMEPKYDGNGVGVIYENGSLKYAITRGNGYEGEDITRAAISSGKFPLNKVFFSKNVPFSGEVRGEVIISRDLFDKKYSQFKNPRNFTAGALKNEEFKEYNDFDFFMYDVYCVDHQFTTENQKIMFLCNNGFQYTLSRVAENPQEVLDYRNEINPKYYPFNIDGIVLKQDIIDPNDSKELRPKKQKAFKWKDEGETTILKDVEWTLSGRTMTPVAIMEPVEIDGSTVKRANLCNPNLIKDLGIKIGDEVEVVKRGMIIPKIERVTRTFNDSKEIEIPTICPECGSSLINDGTRLYCSNCMCPSTVDHRIAKWIKTLDVKGFGPALVSFAIENGVHKIIDLYDPKIQETIKSGWGVNAEKAFSNLLSKKNIPIANIIGGYDIPGLGADLVQTLVDEGYNTFEDLCNLKESQIIEVNGWSDIRAKLFVDSIPTIKDEVIEIIPIIGVKKETFVKKESTKISGMHICVTGKLEYFSRKEIENLLKEKGAIVDSSVTSKTNILCTNDTSSGSSKIQKAIKLGTKIINEMDLKNLLSE